MTVRLSEDDRQFIIEAIAGQPGWHGTPEQRHQLLAGWLRGDGYDEKRAQKFIGHLPLTAPKSAAEQVVNALAGVELARGVNALAVLLGSLMFHRFDDEDRAHEIIAQLIPKPSAPQAVEDPARVFDVPHTRNPFFTGREEILASLRERLVEGGKAGLTQAIAGLGGVGKTQTALEYAYRHKDDYRCVFWALGDTTTSLRASYDKIAGKLGLPPATPEAPNAAVNAILDWLAQEAGYLLVIDNVDDLDAVKSLIPRKVSGAVLVTSRRAKLGPIGVPQPIEIGVLPADDALTFLLDRAGHNDCGESDRMAASALAKEVGYLALALEQAAAYIANNDMSFADYLAEYSRLRLEILTKQGAEFGAEDVSVHTTWQKSMDAVRAASSVAADLLTVSAFLASDAIPYELFMEGSAELGDNLEAAFEDESRRVMTLNDLLSHLERYSLVKRDGEAKTFDVHRMVQEVIRDAMDEEERTQWLDRTLWSLAEIYPGQGALEWPKCDRLVAHWLASTNLAEGLGLLSAANVLQRTGIYFDERANHAPAELLKKRSLVIYERVFGSNHPDVAMSLNNLAQLYRVTGRYAEALPLYERSLSIRERVLDSDHPDVAQSLNNLAGLYEAMGHPSESLPLYERSLAINEQVLGAEHPSLATGLNNLANLYQAMGHPSDALPLYERSLSIRERILGAGHPDVAFSTLGLAALQHGLGDNDLALRYVERSVVIWLAALGDSHPNLIHALKWKAFILRRLGRSQEAEVVNAEAMAAQVRHEERNRVGGS